MIWHFPGTLPTQPIFFYNLIYPLSVTPFANERLFCTLPRPGCWYKRQFGNEVIPRLGFEVGATPKISQERAIPQNQNIAPILCKGGVLVAKEIAQRIRELPTVLAGVIIFHFSNALVPPTNGWAWCQRKEPH